MTDSRIIVLPNVAHPDTPAGVISIQRGDDITL